MLVQIKKQIMNTVYRYDKFNKNENINKKFFTAYKLFAVNSSLPVVVFKFQHHRDEAGHGSSYLME